MGMHDSNTGIRADLPVLSVGMPVETRCRSLAVVSSFTFCFVSFGVDGFTG